MTALVAIVGSANLDVVLSVSRRPDAGETVMGSGYVEVSGGKGANQAIASGRVARSTFIGSVGRDGAARHLEQALHSAGVELDYLVRSDLPTGRAFITLTPEGENSIVVMALANSTLTASAVIAALDSARPTLVLTQLEVPAAVTVAIVEWCSRTGTRFVLNPSPVQGLPHGAIEIADPLIVNQVEARALLGVDADDAQLASALAKRCRSVVLTAGSRGAFVGSGGVIEHITGENVSVVDTTGAGDAFAGTLAAHLALGATLVDAASVANKEAARLIQLTRTDR
ncbi:ribokinase [soil metagenome]